MRRALLFFLIGIGFLVLTACGGGDPEGSGSSGGNGGDSSPNPLEVDLTFAPISGGFRIGNHSDFGDMVSLNITATSGDNIEEKNINIGDFVDGSYDFTGLDDQSDWTFNITGILSDGGQREVKIVFVWDENEEDHRSGGIRAGLDTDGDRRANSVDEDDDNDEVADVDDNCPLVVNTQQTNTDLANDGGDACDEDDDNDGLADDDPIEQRTNSNDVSCSLLADCDGDTVRDGDEVTADCVIEADCDGDTIRDGDEVTADCVIDRDCDDDRVEDNLDLCSTGETDWTSNPSTDNDGDGCEDATEDTDDDNDGLDDGLDQCPTGAVGWVRSSFTDNDGDGCRDRDEDTDDDNDGAGDGVDIDDDGDGLIEIRTAEQLNAVRYALNGNGSRLSEDVEFNTTGCGDGNITIACSGYELVANISLATYANADNGKGWQPLGLDTNNSEDGCQGDPFNRTFEGNGWTISNLDIRRPAKDCVGLFGYVAEGSAIRNLTLHAVRVIGEDNVGGLVGHGESVQIYSSSVMVDNRVIGRQRVGGLVGHGGAAQINSSSAVVNRVEGTRYVGGLVGFGDSGRIVSSSAVVDEVEANRYAGGLVGHGESVQINSSSAVVGEVVAKNEYVGGLVGFGEFARIYSSSAVVDDVKASEFAGGLVGFGVDAWIYSSSAMMGEVIANEYVGGLVGDGESARIYSSSVVGGRVQVNDLSDSSFIVGGLMGDGQRAWIYSSSAVVNLVRGKNNVGGLVGRGPAARIYSSLAVVGNVVGVFQVGGLVGQASNEARIAYSYVVSGSSTPMLVGFGNGHGFASYWDNETSGINTGGNHGEPKTSDQLRNPPSYTGIYDPWDNETVVFSDGEINEPLAVWCDKDNSGSIEASEKIDDNLIWDFGTSSEYPAISCTPLAPADWRDWWSLDEDGDPLLNQNRLDDHFPP